MIIVIPTFIICLIIFIYSLLKDKILFLNIRINEIEEKINSTLIKRKELIKDSEKLIKKILNTDKQIFESFSDINEKKMNMIKLDRELLACINEFYLIKDKYKKLKNNEEFQKITFAINETEDLLNAYKNYYNNVAEKYNNFISKFPINIAAFIKGKKQKEFFDKNI